jgi:hypothetical protein
MESYPLDVLLALHSSRAIGRSVRVCRGGLGVEQL